MSLNIFPGFTQHGVVAPAIQEAAVVFNAEGVDALSGIADVNVAWADVGTRVTKIDIGIGKIPVRLTPLLGFEPFNGERRFHKLAVAAVSVKVMPWQLNIEWPVVIEKGEARLKDMYGISGTAGDIVSHARALKADMAGELVIAGMTNVALGMTAKALTLPQPGFENGLPLFSDATSGLHYSNPLDAGSRRFPNLYLGAGKITASGVWEKCINDMMSVPHPTKANATMGLPITDIIGPTHMFGPFQALARQELSLQTTTVPGNIGAATSNVLRPDMLSQALTMIGAAGGNISPWRFWIAPQLDSHPYVVANPTSHMWLTVSRAKRGASWIEFGGPNQEFVPQITMLGEASEEGRKSRSVRLLGDLDGGAAAGLPHFVKQYLETTPVAE